MDSEPDGEHLKTSQEAQAQILQLQLRYAAQERHAVLKNAYHTIAAMLNILTMDRSLVPSDEINALGRHLRVMSSVTELLDSQATSYSLIRLESLLTCLNGSLQLSPPMQFKDEDLWLTGSQATSLALILSEWRCAASKNAGVMFSIEVGFTPEQVVFTAYPLARRTVDANAQSFVHQMAEDLVRFDFKRACTYSLEEDELRAHLSLRRDILETPEGRRVAKS